MPERPSADEDLPLIRPAIEEARRVALDRVSELERWIHKARDHATTSTLYELRRISKSSRKWRASPLNRSFVSFESLACCAMLDTGLRTSGRTRSANSGSETETNRRVQRAFWTAPCVLLVSRV